MDRQRCIAGLAACVASIGLVVAAPAANASFIAYSVSNPAGNQNWPGALGLDFNVVKDIVVIDLGVFDDNPPNGISGTLNVAIYNRTTGALQGSVVQFTADSQGTAVGDYQFKPLATPVTLPAGFLGSVVAWGFTSTDQNGNDNILSNAPGVSTNDGGGLVSFVDSRWSTSVGPAWPALWSTATGSGACGSNKADCFAAGNFTFKAVPEPATAAMLGLGLLGIGLSRRRRSAG